MEPPLIAARRAAQQARNEQHTRTKKNGSAVGALRGSYYPMIAVVLLLKFILR